MRLPKTIPFVLAILIPWAGATFGTATSIRRTVSDIALDERRGRVSAAYFSAGPEVMSTSTLRLQRLPMPVPLPPSYVASRRMWP